MFSSLKTGTRARINQTGKNRPNGLSVFSDMLLQMASTAAPTKATVQSVFCRQREPNKSELKGTKIILSACGQATNKFDVESDCSESSYPPMNVPNANRLIRK